jgi:hypothetical protein
MLEFLYFTTDAKWCVAAVKSSPVLHFGVVIFVWSFGIIDTSTIKCWEILALLSVEKY